MNCAKISLDNNITFEIHHIANLKPLLHEDTRGIHDCGCAQSLCLIFIIHSTLLFPLVGLHLAGLHHQVSHSRPTPTAEFETFPSFNHSHRLLDPLHHHTVPLRCHSLVALLLHPLLHEPLSLFGVHYFFLPLQKGLTTLVKFLVFLICFFLIVIVAAEALKVVAILPSPSTDHVNFTSATRPTPVLRDERRT